MRTILAPAIGTLLSVATTTMAATVEYQHPDLTIVAREEPLDAVLKSLGKEMRIYITIPTGLNPVVNCAIQHQPVKQAFKNLLGDMSYSLEWEEQTGQLVGLTILSGGSESAVASVSSSSAQSQSVEQEQAAPAPVASSGGQGARIPAEQSGTLLATHDTAMAEHEARMETVRAEQEIRMAEEQEAQEERMREEVARHDAETAAYVESQGLQRPE